MYSKIENTELGYIAGSARGSSSGDLAQPNQEQQSGVYVLLL